MAEVNGECVVGCHLIRAGMCVCVCVFVAGILGISGLLNI